MHLEQIPRDGSIRPTRDPQSFGTDADLKDFRQSQFQRRLSGTATEQQCPVNVEQTDTHGSILQDGARATNPSKNPVERTSGA